MGWRSVTHAGSKFRFTTLNLLIQACCGVGILPVQIKQVVIPFLELV